MTATNPPDTAGKPAPRDTTYPLTSQLSVNFSVYEDRLVVRARRGPKGPVNLLLTRRMVLIVLQQLVGMLPKLEGLDQTPAQYWQDVLQMAHQRALDAKANADKASAGKDDGDSAEPEQAQPESPGDIPIYLATELTLRRDDTKLLTAFKGLPMPKAMTQRCPPVPVVAISLEAENVHQLVQLLLTKAQEAKWNLPVDLPWLDNPKAPEAGEGGTILH